MCDPVTAAGLALSAGGTFLQTREQNNNISRANQAREDAFTAHTIRQRGFQDEAGAAFNENIQNQGSDNFQNEKENEANEIKQAFSDIRTTPDYNQGLVSSTPKNVVIARQRASDEVNAETDRNVDAFATLNGYQNAGFNQGLSRNQYARAFGDIQDRAGRDTGLLNLDINQAVNNSQKASSALPAIISAAGKGLSLYGAANPGSSFFNKTIEGPLPASGVGPGIPTQQAGLFSKAFGGL